MMNRRDFVRVTALTAMSGSIRGEARPQSSQSGTEPRLFAQFARLKAGSVSPAGWLEDYCRINGNGWVLKQAKDQLPDIWGRYIHRTSNPQLGFTANDEWLDPPDYGAYFGDALVHYGVLKAGADVESEAQIWATQLVASQDQDGYIGAFEPEARWQCWLEIFQQSLLIDALLFHYESNQDPAVLKACQRAANLIMEVWYGPNKLLKPQIFSGHGVIIVRTMGKLYAVTGDTRYVDFGREILARFGMTKEYLSGGNQVVYQHNAVASEHVGLPGAVYEYTGDPELLKASEAAWEMMLPYLSVDGSPHGNEMILRTGSRENCEHCGAVEWMTTSRDMARITGKVKYADAVERAMFNGYPAPVAPDGMALGYMHSPNQLVATEWSQPHDNDGDEDYWASRQHYSTAHEPLCCNSNGPRGIPFYIESMVQRSPSGLVVTYYGPCETITELPKAGRVTLTLDTEYPFEDEVRLTVHAERPALFPIQFRIPGWCHSADLEVNGAKSQATVSAGSFATVERTWSSNDKIILRFSNPIVVTQRRRSEFRLRARVAIVERGPLVFSLPVEADFRAFHPPAHGPGKDIQAYRLFPKNDAVWNYAFMLDPDHPQQSLSLKKLPVPAGSRPWDSHPPIGLEVKARRALNWQMAGQTDYPRTPSLPLAPMQLAEKIETVTLVPFGATRLRITYLPLITAAELAGGETILAPTNRRADASRQRSYSSRLPCKG